MREILFRGKRVDNGEWETGYYVRANYHWHKYGIHKDWIVTGACSNGGWFALHGRYPVISDTVGQYTGLQDKNGKRIFEGDVVTFKTTNYCFTPCVVEYREDTAQFVVSKNGRRYPMADDFSYEVIGNIYDHKELLDANEV